MKPRPGWRALAPGAALALLAVAFMRLAGSARAAAPAPASPTTGAFLPVIYVPPPTATPLAVTPPAATDWHSVLNYYRAAARLPAVSDNSAWSAGAANHAHYMVSNDVLAYTEDPATPWYTAAGATEAANSNLMLSDNVNTTDQQALDFWMAKPFHALGLLNPALLSTGFGSFREDAGPADPYRMGAVIDVRQGRGALSGAVTFPIEWPSHNSTVYLTSYDGNEQPDPLTACPGYSAPSGLPILVQAGPGGSAFIVGAHSIVPAHTNTSLPHCAFTANTYTNPFDPDLQTLGQQILAARDAVVLIPQQPLLPGQSYTVAIVINDQNFVWTFNVAP